MSGYSEKDHAENLLKLLELNNPCSLCSVTQMQYFIGSTSYCSMCRSFVGLNTIYNSCPCTVLGKKESIKRTWIALEGKGYI